MLKCFFAFSSVTGYVKINKNIGLRKSQEALHAEIEAASVTSQFFLRKATKAESYVFGPSPFRNKALKSESI